MQRPQDDAIVIRLWEIYLLRSRIHLNTTLCAYAIDKRPLQGHAQDSSRVSFRFMLSDWEKNIKPLFAENSIPYEVIGLYKTEVKTRTEKKTVYIAEDDLNILFAINTMLEEAGYDVVMSHCGAAMLKSDLPPADVFILDNRMPDVDGIEVCRHLKAQPATRNVPIIMISAFNNAGMQARSAGVDDFLEKPFQMKDLLHLVAKHTSTETRHIAKNLPG